MHSGSCRITTFSTTRSTIFTSGSGRAPPQRRQLARSLQLTRLQQPERTLARCPPTNLPPFLTHHAPSQVASASAQSKRLSATWVSVPVGHLAAFFRFFVDGLG